MRIGAEPVQKFEVEGVQHGVLGGGHAGQSVDGADGGVRSHRGPPWAAVVHETSEYTREGDTYLCTLSTE